MEPRARFVNRKSESSKARLAVLEGRVRAPIDQTGLRLFGLRKIVIGTNLLLTNARSNRVKSRLIQAN